MIKNPKIIITIIMLAGCCHYIIKARQMDETAPKPPTVTVYNHTDYVPDNSYGKVLPGDGVVEINPGNKEIPFGGSIKIQPGVHSVGYRAQFVKWFGSYAPQRYWETFATFNFLDGQTYEVIGHPAPGPCVERDGTVKCDNHGNLLVRKVGTGSQFGFIPGA